LTKGMCREVDTCVQLNMESIQADQKLLDLYETKKQKLYLRRSLTLTKIDDAR